VTDSQQASHPASPPRCRSKDTAYYVARVKTKMHSVTDHLLIAANKRVSILTDDKLTSFAKTVFATSSGILSFLKQVSNFFHQ